ncbi:MAG TPA: twin-arginine translocase subunit TatC [Thermoanaerobaculia bacterium]
MEPLRERLLSNADGEEDLARMSLLDHLEELRRRLLWSVVALAVAFFPCWYLVDKLFVFLEAPIINLPAMHGKKLAFTGLTDPFVLYFKVAALAAVFVAAPFILYQLWKFISPGLYKRERLYILPFLFFGSGFFLLGGAFAYYIAFPYATQFLLGIGENFEPVITIERYFSFLMTMILGLGLMFELPIVIFILCQVGVVTPRFLMRHFRYAIVIIFIVAAVVTPTTDIVNMCIFAFPTLGLYLLGVGAAAVAGRNKAQRKAEEALARAAAGEAE